MTKILTARTMAVVGGAGEVEASNFFHSFFNGTAKTFKVVWGNFKALFFELAGLLRLNKIYLCFDNLRAEVLIKLSQEFIKNQLAIIVAF